MEKAFAVIGGDSRMRYLAQYLRRIGRTVDVFAVDGLPDSCADLKETLHRAKVVILPMPAIKDGTIRNLQGASIDPSEIADYLRSDAQVFGGKLGSSFAPRCAVKDYSEWEPLCRMNAVLTAEGAIQLAMEQTERALFGSRCLVIGAGRIGMQLAKKLSALGADVTVSARKEADYARIRAEHLTADVTGSYGLGLAQYDCIFNTVPAKILTVEQIEHTKPGCVLIELASAPGGFSQEDCRLLGRKYVSGGGLPGIVAPKTAGIWIADAILADLRQEVQ